MTRGWWLLLALLMSIVLVHDVSMAAMGHDAVTVEDANRLAMALDAAVYHHQAGANQEAGETDDTVPESCGTVRLTPARQDTPDRSPLPDLIFGTVGDPSQSRTRSISAQLLVRPVPDSPSACLARFQVFRI